MPQRRRQSQVIAFVGILLVTGCAASTPTAQKTATAALSQLTNYEVEVQRKIKAENDYYESAMEAASQRVVELWDNEQPFQLEKLAKKLATSNLRKNESQIGPTLVTLMDKMTRAWVTRDTSYESRLQNTQKVLRENRKKLELERGKIRALRGKLQALSAPRSDREMLIMTIAFAREVKKQYDALEE